MYDDTIYEDPERAHAISQCVDHLEALNVIEDADLLVIEEALGMAYDFGAAHGLVDLIGSDEASQALNVGKSWLLRYAKRHDIGHVIGNQRAFGPADLTVIQQRRTTPGPVPTGDDAVS